MGLCIVCHLLKVTVTAVTRLEVDSPLYLVPRQVLGIFLEAGCKAPVVGRLSQKEVMQGPYIFFAEMD